jgi:hypothetical protein
MDCPPTYKQIRLWEVGYLAGKGTREQKKKEEKQKKSRRMTEQNNKGNPERGSPKERINI